MFPIEPLFLPFPYAPMHDVAPSAVSTAEIIEARICSDHLSVSFLVIRFSFFFYFGTDFTDFHGFFRQSRTRRPRVWRESGTRRPRVWRQSGTRRPRVWRQSRTRRPRVWRQSRTRRPRVWRQSTVACDFTLGPDPSIHCALDFTSGPDPSIHCALDFTSGPDPSEHFTLGPDPRVHSIKAHW